MQKNILKVQKQRKKGYSWLEGAKDSSGNLIKARTFSDIQRECDMHPDWKKQYDLACWTNHASPQGTFKRLGNSPNQNAIPVGHSNYGITTPAEHSAIALSWMTAMFINIFPNLDGVSRIGLLNKWIELIRRCTFQLMEEIDEEEVSETSD